MVKVLKVGKLIATAQPRSLGGGAESLLTMDQSVQESDFKDRLGPPSGSRESLL